MKDRAKLRGNYEGFAAVIFVIDSMERSRFPEARIYLHAWLGHETALDTPILIMANKQDLPGAATGLLRPCSRADHCANLFPATRNLRRCVFCFRTIAGADAACAFQRRRFLRRSS
eukprot:3849041-Rhodomonas_salina.1